MEDKTRNNYKSYYEHFKITKPPPYKPTRSSCAFGAIASEHPARHAHVVAPPVAVVVLHRVQPLRDPPRLGLGLGLGLALTLALTLALALAQP